MEEINKFVSFLITHKLHEICDIQLELSELEKGEKKSNFLSLYWKYLDTYSTNEKEKNNTIAFLLSYAEMRIEQKKIIVNFIKKHH